MLEQMYSLNDSSSNKTDKETKSKSNWKKYLIIILTSLIIIAAIIILIIFILSPSEKNDNENDKKRSFGIIKCEYDIQKKEVIILGQEFEKVIDLEIFIDNEKIKYSKEYTFQRLGIHSVEFRLYELNISMDYMFKNVSSLINAQLISESQINIISMSNTFENCINLNKFESSNFNTSLVQSFHKLFYNTNLNIFKIDKSFDTSNAIDMSYMFASSSIGQINFSNFN